MKENKEYIIKNLKNELEFAKKRYNELISQPKDKLDKEAVNRQLDAMATLKMRLELAESQPTNSNPNQMLLFD